MLFPALPAGAGPEQVESFARRARVSEFFGGRPGSGEAERGVAAQRELPRPEMPASPAPAQARKKKEGC